ncbi:hypothetical protein SERLA73DRAFT_176866 [Serpula lacrymans var. lacrymans S7.3]|uniref:Ferritin-like domain-containing protein n=1 Tax=Serpula lacrymans var. lacrymans (strain S7.3) TaxID=936435 RepID=F8PQC5_SERL3|nr:hypothetical protein SERLA73DRAFT_176866 [Serpula lacrymans var. lacrymans S7.3]
MHPVKSLLPFLFLGFASALPLKRASSNSDSSDLLVLKFANVLEQLETSFYNKALETFNAADFESAGFVSSQVPLQQFQRIASDESTHTTTLEAAIQALGGQPISGCSFNFSSALTDVTTMAATARAVENVGVSAYLGASSLITNPVLATAAASIMTVEARHQTVLNILNGQSAIPQAFDIALNPSEVLAIAGSFVSGCDVGVLANPALTVTSNGSLQAGSKLAFQADTINGSISENQLFCQTMAGGMAISISQPMGNCMVPEGINGPAVMFITSDSQPLLNNVRDAATSSIVAGPALVFIDSQQESLGKLVRPGSNTTSSGTTTTAQTTMTSSSTSISSSSTSLAAATTITLSAHTSNTSTLATTSTVSSSSSTAVTSSTAITSSTAVTVSSTLSTTSLSTLASTVSSSTALSASTSPPSGTTTRLLSPSQASAVLASLESAKPSSAASSASSATPTATQAKRLIRAITLRGHRVKIRD